MTVFPNSCCVVFYFLLGNIEHEKICRLKSKDNKKLIAANLVLRKVLVIEFCKLQLKEKK